MTWIWRHSSTFHCCKVWECALDTSTCSPSQWCELHHLAWMCFDLNVLLLLPYCPTDLPSNHYCSALLHCCCYCCYDDDADDPPTTTNHHNDHYYYYYYYYDDDLPPPPPLPPPAPPAPSLLPRTTTSSEWVEVIRGFCPNRLPRMLHFTQSVPG